MRLHAVLEAGQLQVEFTRRHRWQRVDHPLLVPVRGHERVFTQVGEVLGNGDLRHLEHFLEVADAERTFGEQVDDAQARFVAQATVNLNQW